MQALHLAFDTSTSRPCVALMAGDRVLSEWLGPDSLKHHETLLIGIDQCLKGYELRDLAFLSVGVGPGTFTGLRIGITTAKFLADPLKIPCVEVSSLRALGEQNPQPDHTVWAVADAKAKRVYATKISASLTTSGEEECVALAPEAFAAQIQADDFLLGEGAWIYRAHWPQSVTLASEEENLLRGSSIGKLGWRLYQQGLTVSANELQPKYLKAGNSVV
jgi:tRNA threonylcarbamoyladenosine biosynthesis protein TsaB